MTIDLEYEVALAKVALEEAAAAHLEDIALLREQHHQASLLLWKQIEGCRREVEDLRQSLTLTEASLCEVQGVLSSLMDRNMRFLALLSGRPEEVLAAVREAAVEVQAAGAKPLFQDRGV